VSLSRNESGAGIGPIFCSSIRFLGFLLGPADLFDERYTLIYQSNRQLERLQLFCIDRIQGDIRMRWRSGENQQSSSRQLCGQSEIFREVDVVSEKSGTRCSQLEFHPLPKGEPEPF